MGVRGEIVEALAARLASIKASNGYATDVQEVYYDQIPMGIRLPSYKLPAIFLLERADALVTEHKVLKGDVTYDLQLWHNDEIGDVTMTNFVGDVFRAIYANSATAQREDAFRELHANLVRVVPVAIESDLNMIEANRVYGVTFTVEYRCKLYQV